ncbi:MAG: HDOD domain-containing protein [Rhodocyclaceae bacterium]|nr:HDOD domain-containing protein [Rhodocyclaceae bacterium]
MPAFPKSVQKILELTRNINCLPKELVAVIEKDPVMTVKILKVINSAYYSLPNKITSVGQSVVYLGINTIKNLSLGFAAVGILPRFNAAGFDIQNYLMHSLIVASVARQLAQLKAKGEVDPSDCYIAGLLHDFGKAVFAQFMAAEFRTAMTHAEENNVPLHEAEMLVIGTDHAFVGAMLAKRWQFADELVQCIQDHHRMDAEPSAMLDCLRTANQISRKLDLGKSGNPWRDTEAAAAPARFGDDLDATIASLGDMERFIADAQMFAQVSNS